MPKHNNLKKKASLIGVATLTLLCFAGCGGEEQAVTDQHVIPVQFNVEEKVVFVNNFVNLTDNQDLNIFEEGIADMLEERLKNTPSVMIVPRHTMQTMLAVADSPQEIKIVDAARSEGVEYIIDGWISATENGTYKAYANLINLEGEKEEIHNRFAVVEFANRDSALEKINELVEEVTNKISRNREELESLVDYRDFDYEFFLKFHNAISSANHGRPDIAISMMESTLAEYQKKLEEATVEKQRGEIRIMTLYAHFLLAQAYAEVGDPERSLAHVDMMKLTEEEQKKVGLWVNLLDALRAENTGHYAEASKKYKQLAEKWPYESFFYLRMAEMALRQNTGQEKALAVLKHGLELMPDSSLLHKRVAALRMESEGEQAIEDYAAENAENERATVTAEVVSSMINERLEDELLEKNPNLLPLIVTVDSTNSDEFTRIGRVNIDTSKLENSIDYSCEDTTEGVVKMANLAVRCGNVNFAYKIADNIQVHGSAPNSEDAYHTIYALAKTAEGDFRLAKEHAVKISKDKPARYFVFGNLLLHQGSNEKAVKYFEKAMQMEKGEPHPLLYYNIANAYLLAGNYKEWSKYNEKFLDSSVKHGLIPEELKVKILSMPQEHVVLRKPSEQ